MDSYTCLAYVRIDDEWKKEEHATLKEVAEMSTRGHMIATERGS